MSFAIVRRSKLSRPQLLGFASALLVTLAAGIFAGRLVEDVPPIHAMDCQRANETCPDLDGTKTSAMTVSHHTGPGYLGTSTVVEPYYSETWAIKGYWTTYPAPCTYYDETAYATVTWNGSAFVLSDVTLTTNIVAIGICQGATCDAGGGGVHGFSYKLIVDIADPYKPPGPQYNLHYVQYRTTTVDDGYTIEDPEEVHGDCSTDDLVEPTSANFTFYDDPNDEWTEDRCHYDCTIVGASGTIYYD